MNVFMAYDVDGALADTNREVYNRTKEAWKLTYREEYPFSYDVYLDEIRPDVILIEDIFILSNSRLFGDTAPEDIDSARGYYREHYKTDTANSIFYDRRAAVMKEDIKKWAEEQPLFDGVPDMMREIESMGVKSSVVSSKNEDAIKAILGHYGLLGFIDTIIDKDKGKRPNQLKEFMDRYLPPDRQQSGLYMVYDDMSENLDVAEKMGMIPIAAPQGYDSDENLKEFEKAYPEELPEVVLNHIREWEGS